MIHLREDEIGPSRLGVVMYALGLGRIARAFGIGIHSDRQLCVWACRRHENARAAFYDAAGRLRQHSRPEAEALYKRWGSV